MERVRTDRVVRLIARLRQIQSVETIRIAGIDQQSRSFVRARRHFQKRAVSPEHWIAPLAGKTDVVPGRNNRMSFSADKPGEYIGQCTEFCGLSHANMRQEAVALNAADFETWKANQLEPYQSPEAESDRALAEQDSRTRSRGQIDVAAPRLELRDGRDEEGGAVGAFDPEHAATGSPTNRSATPRQ